MLSPKDFFVPLSTLKIIFSKDNFFLCHLMLLKDVLCVVGCC